MKGNVRNEMNAERERDGQTDKYRTYVQCSGTRHASVVEWLRVRVRTHNLAGQQQWYVLYVHIGTISHHAQQLVHIHHITTKV